MQRVLCGNCVMTATGAAVGRFLIPTPPMMMQCVCPFSRSSTNWERELGIGRCRRAAGVSGVGVPSDVRIVVAALNSVVVVSG
jgi:hypothetical protein